MPSRHAQMMRYSMSRMPETHMYTGADGILSDRAKVEGTLMIDCSTIAPGVAQEVAKAAYATGCDFVDAPVSGGVVGAEAASLTFMVGANGADIVDRARGVLDLMGKKCVHCGTVGSGQAAKLSNRAEEKARALAGGHSRHRLRGKRGLQPSSLPAAVAEVWQLHRDGLLLQAAELLAEIESLSDAG